MATKKQPKITEFRIENGIKIPPRNRNSGRRGTKYPFVEMKVGQSFLSAMLKTPSSLYATAKAAGVKIAVRPEGDGYRVWRVA